MPRPGDTSYVEDPPEPITKTPPLYPEEARRAGIQGVVTVEALIGKDGLVKSTRVLVSIPALDAAAEEAVRRWSFKPARLDGKPVAIRAAIPVRFTLHGSTAADPSRAAFENAWAELGKASRLFERDAILREKIIRLALALSLPPEASAAARTHLERGRALLDSLATPGVAEHAIAELTVALNDAPWWAEPYFQVAKALEATGRPGDAATALDLYLVADPRSTRWEEVRGKLVEMRAAAARKPAR